MKLVPKLTAQVPVALRELLSGVETTCAQDVPRDLHPALVATLLRLLFVLRAEAEGLVELGDEHSLIRLVRELAEEAARDRHAMAMRHEAWARVGEIVDVIRARYEPLPASPIFGDEHRWLEGLPLDDAATFAVLANLAFVDGTLIPFDEIEVEQLGHFYEALMGFEARRRKGSHYTSRALADRASARTIEPLLQGLGPEPRPERILDLRICDPAMGSGAFLLAVCRRLGDSLVLCWRTHGMPPGVSEDDALFFARRLVARHCLYGLDKDPFAVELARLSLWLESRAKNESLRFVDENLRRGDALVDRPLAFLDRESVFVWEEAFAEVFDRSQSGFDAIVGNPPWISYAGRAAQPLDPELKAFYAERYEAFSGYRNLQGLFVERAARLLRPGGRLGLVLPSSMSEQGGYGPTRLAHDRLCEPDRDLSDLGEGDFEGVFQPSMILTSTKRGEPVALESPRPWPIERPDLDAISRAILAKMSRAPLPAHLFGERGIQTTGADRFDLSSEPTARHTVPLRSGSDVFPFSLREPSFHADPIRLGGRMRTPEAWREVRFFVRQTARFPMAALSDGLAFRNSLLAGFEDDEHPATFLIAYLNSSPIRFLHYVRHRDARQGMPQVKVGHLRAIPAPPTRDLVASLAEVGERLSERNRGIDEDAQRRIDELVADAFDLNRDEREKIASWVRQVR